MLLSRIFRSIASPCGFVFPPFVSISEDYVIEGPEWEGAMDAFAAMVLRHAVDVHDRTSHLIFGLHVGTAAATVLEEQEPTVGSVVAKHRVVLSEFASRSASASYRISDLKRDAQGCIKSIKRIYSAMQDDEGGVHPPCIICGASLVKVETEGSTDQGTVQVYVKWIKRLKFRWKRPANRAMYLATASYGDGTARRKRGTSTESGIDGRVHDLFKELAAVLAFESLYQTVWFSRQQAVAAISANKLELGGEARIDPDDDGGRVKGAFADYLKAAASSALGRGAVLDANRHFLWLCMLHGSQSRRNLDSMLRARHADTLRMLQKEGMLQKLAVLTLQCDLLVGLLEARRKEEDLKAKLNIKVLKQQFKTFADAVGKTLSQSEFVFLPHVAPRIRDLLTSTSAFIEADRSAKTLEHANCLREIAVHLSCCLAGIDLRSTRAVRLPG